MCLPKLSWESTYVLMRNLNEVYFAITLLPSTFLMVPIIERNCSLFAQFICSKLSVVKMSHYGPSGGGGHYGRGKEHDKCSSYKVFY